MDLKILPAVKVFFLTVMQSPRLQNPGVIFSLTPLPTNSSVAEKVVRQMTVSLNTMSFLENVNPQWGLCQKYYV